MKIESFQLKLDENKTIEVDFRDLAERANGSVFVKYGDTCVMVNCTMSKKEIDGLDFFPLTTLYEERFYAVGKIFGSRFQRREGRPTEQCTLNSRLIDRAIRPLFPQGLKREVQIVINCLSWDKTIDPAVLGLFGASLALSTSDIPWDGPLAPINFGERDGKIVIFPSVENKDDSKIDMTISFLRSESKKEILINMIEAGVKEISEEEIGNIMFSGKDYAEKLITFQEEIVQKLGKEKVSLKTIIKDEEVENDIKNFLNGKIEKAIFENGSLNELKEEFSEYIKKYESDENKVRYAKHVLEYESEKTMHDGAIIKDIRIDGRNSKQVRKIECDTGLFKRIHGTGMFCRGQTKVLSFLTLGAPGDQRIMEEMEVQGKKRFMHHYNFPPYSVGETKPMRGPGRREIGHGMLGEKALKAVLPNVEDFPYTIRIVSEVLCSNGSSSMASTCGACLALMDGGVPIKSPVSGIAMGLMIEMGKESIENKNYKILTDVQGEEDHFGDMDFKVAGTKNGITAIQMDIKIRGITEKITKETLVQAKIARQEILEKMLQVLPEPRKDISLFAPRIYILKINPEKIGEVIGPGGKIINEIIDACNVTIDIEDTGEVYITADNKESAEKAVEWIKNITHEVQVGEIFKNSIVKRILDFGAFVEFLPGQEGMVHISQLDEKRIAKVTDVLKIGDVIPVKVIAIDEQGRINLSLKEAKK